MLIARFSWRLHVGSMSQAQLGRALCVSPLSDVSAANGSDRTAAQPHAASPIKRRVNKVHSRHLLASTPIDATYSP